MTTCACPGTTHEPDCWLFRPALTRDTYMYAPRSFGPCPKCGWTDIGISYHAGHPSLGCTVWACRTTRRKDEHFYMSCRRCNYEWQEAA